jgi:hypothetical protein
MQEKAITKTCLSKKCELRAQSGRALRIAALLLLSLMLPFLLSTISASAQTTTFTKDGLEYVLEFPSPLWQAVSRVDVHEHFEFTNGADQKNGHLRLRKLFVPAASTPRDLFLKDEKWQLQFLPGYIVCNDCEGEKFNGHLNGAAFSYEYVTSGRPMAGRIYYLQLNSRTFYSLHFTVTSDKLASLRSQMDFIAESFRVK